MDSTFVRKDFYIDPPADNASAEEWLKWLKKDQRKAAAAKAAYTRSLDHADTPEEFQETATRKVNGRWVQCTMVGFTGDPDSDAGAQAEQAVESDQEEVAILRTIEQHRNIRGGTRKGKSARRHANKKRRRKKKE